MFINSFVENLSSLFWRPPPLLHQEFPSPYPPSFLPSFLKETKLSLQITLQKFIWKIISDRINRKSNYPSINSRLLNSHLLLVQLRAINGNFLLHFAVAERALLSKHSLNISNSILLLRRASTGKIDYFDVNVKKTSQWVTLAAKSQSHERASHWRFLIKSL